MDKLTQNRIYRFLNGLGEKVTKSIEVYLLGGTAMVLTGLKSTTKDIDLGVTSDRDFELLRRVFEDHPEYEIETVVPDPDGKLVVRTSEGVVVELFNGRVVDKLELSSRICQRSRLVHKSGRLNAYALSVTDLYLFKWITGRLSDIDDLNLLLRAGADPSCALIELDKQPISMDRRIK